MLYWYEIRIGVHSWRPSVSIVKKKGHAKENWKKLVQFQLTEKILICRAKRMLIVGTYGSWVTSPCWNRESLEESIIPTKMSWLCPPLYLRSTFHGWFWTSIGYVVSYIDGLVIYLNLYIDGLLDRPIIIMVT